ncbi:MAG: hypothetical protein D6805_04540 [Planctomycetota bacterium]|nr:MAG: hypothetical protein D6805_04540 [Planctomycetota bacterium]
MRIRVAQFNIGHLTGPCTKNQPRKHYIREVFQTSQGGFFSDLARKMVNKISSSLQMSSRHARAEGKNIRKLMRRNLPKNPYFLLKGIVQFIKQEKIDVLSLNEVDRVWPGFDQLEFIQEYTQLKHAAFTTSYSLSIAGIPLFNNGNAILSRYPLKNIQVAYIDVPGLFHKTFGWGRRALKAEVDFGAFSYPFVSTHLEDSHIPLKEIQARKLRKFLEMEVGDCILMGDLNTMLKAKNKFTYGDRDYYTGTPLRILESLIDMSAHPQWFTQMFVEDGQPFRFGTYPVIIEQRRQSFQLAYPPDRFLDYILSLKTRQFSSVSEGRKRYSITVRSKEILTHVYFSDHFPVVAELEWKEVSSSKANTA